MKKIKATVEFDTSLLGVLKSRPSDPSDGIAVVTHQIRSML
ncbi:hypothetical protein ACMFWY_10595 [Roseiconus sp. JC912]